MEFPSALVLEDERVRLSELDISHLDALSWFAENEPETWQFSIHPLRGKEDMKEYIEATLEQRSAGKEYPFVVFDKQAGAYAGSTRFYDIQPRNQTTQLGYTWYGKAFRRTGLNRHCKWLMLSYAFEQWGMERVEFRADDRNARSIQAMKDIGCTVEGVLRNSSPAAMGGRRNAIVLSILKEEWLNEVKENLKKKIH